MSIVLYKSLIALALVTLVMLVVLKTVFALKAERKIDKRLRETRARISRSIIEVEKYKNSISEVAAGEEVSCIKDSKDAPKVKKTRAMSMEERWADYARSGHDKK